MILFLIHYFNRSLVAIDKKMGDNISITANASSAAELRGLPQWKPDWQCCISNDHQLQPVASLQEARKNSWLKPILAVQ